MKALNSGLEAAVRLLVILDVEYPTHRSLDELIALDYLAIHSNDFEGPPSLHPPLPLRAADVGAARDSIRGGLELLVHRGLAELRLANDGFRYVASEDLHAIAAVLESPYLVALQGRADWVKASRLLEAPEDVRSVLKGIAEAWPIQVKEAGGANA
jgi:hypothetical protein